MKEVALVGSWGADIQGQNKPGEGEGGVGVFDILPERLQLISRAAPSVNAGGLCVTADGKYAYSTDERKDRDGYHGTGGGICAYRLHEDGTIELINAVSSAGAYPAYCCVDSKSRFVFAVNHGNHEEVVTRSVKYEDGTSGCERVFDEGSIGLFPIQPDGSIGRCSELVGFNGHGTVEWFQWTPHPHSVMLDPTEKFVLVGDKGTDLIRIFRVDYENGKLEPLPPCHLPDGTCARHLAFHPTLPLLYCNGESGNCVCLVSFDSETGAMECLQTIETLPEDYVPHEDPSDPFAHSQSSDIRVHCSGKYLYVANRGDDSIACFSLDDRGRMSRLEFVPCGGAIPRFMNIDPEGRYLYSVNQRSNNVVQFEISWETGHLTATGNVTSVNNPANIQFTYI